MVKRTECLLQIDVNLGSFRNCGSRRQPFLPGSLPWLVFCDCNPVIQFYGPWWLRSTLLSTVCILRMEEKHASFKLANWKLPLGTSMVCKFSNNTVPQSLKKCRLIFAWNSGFRSLTQPQQGSPVLALAAMASKMGRMRGLKRKREKPKCRILRQ